MNHPGEDIVHVSGRRDDMSGEEDVQGSKILTDVKEAGSNQTPGKDDADPAEGSGRPRWLLPVVSAVVVVVFVVTGVAPWMVVSGRGHDREAERCSRAVALLETPAGGSAARVARWREAAEVSSDQVRDVKTVIAMARDAKDLDDARAALDAKKDEASRLLGDSDGKVADNASREALQQAIGQAEQTKGDKAQAWRDAAASLQSAIDQVNASMQAKIQAGQQAKASQQAAPSYRPSYGQSGGGGWTPPTPVQQPVPSTPQGRGGESGAQSRLPPLDTTHHGCNPDGSCGIG